MDAEKRAKRMLQIRALLAKADSTPEPGEADVFRAKAEELMLKYRIEQAELGVEHDDNMPRDEHYDFSWYRGEHSGALWMLFLDVARHCNVKVVHWKWISGRMPIVGMDNDRAYFDTLFTGIMLEFMKGLEPKPDPGKPMIENLVKLKESGQKWLRIAEQLHQIGQLTDAQFNPDPINVLIQPTGRWRMEYYNETEARKKKQVHHLNFSGQYTAYCKKHDRPRLRVTPAIYQRSFKLGFTSRMYERLQAIREAAVRSMESTDSGSSRGLAIVLADAWTRANAKAIELYGQPPERRGGGGGRARSLAIDPESVMAGRDAANRINLGNQAEVSTGRGELTR